MVDKRRLRNEEFRLIEWHNRSLIDAADKAIAKFQSIPRGLRSGYIARQLDYWKFVKAALEWSTAIARQRLDRNEGDTDGDTVEIIRLVERESRDSDSGTTRQGIGG